MAEPSFRTVFVENPPLEFYYDVIRTLPVAPETIEFMTFLHSAVRGLPEPDLRGDAAYDRDCISRGVNPRTAVRLYPVFSADRKNVFSPIIRFGLSYALRGCQVEAHLLGKSPERVEIMDDMEGFLGLQREGLGLLLGAGYMLEEANLWLSSSRNGGCYQRWNDGEDVILMKREARNPEERGQVMMKLGTIDYDKKTRLPPEQLESLISWFADLAKKHAWSVDERSA